MLLKKNKKNTPKEQVTNNKVQKSKVKYSSNQPSIKEKIVPAKVITPKTCQDMFKMFFKSTNEELDLIEISDNIYSMCVEFEDISFAKADYSTVENIFLKWVEFLNSFSEHIHIQVINADKYLNTNEYKKQYILQNEDLDDGLSELQNEFNHIIEKNLSKTQTCYIAKRYLVFSQKAENYRAAYNSFQTILAKTETKFHDLKSKIQIVSNNERLRFIHDTLNVETMQNREIDNIFEYAKKNDLTVYDVLSPKKINLSEKDLIEIENEKYLRLLYVSKLPNSMTPRFYNSLITMEDVNIITTLNIQPTNNAKSINRVDKQISGMKTERLDKVKRANKNGYDYSVVQDERLEDSIREAEQFKEDLQKNGQKVFETNFLICVISPSFEKLNKDTQKIIDKASEHLIEIRPMWWQQIEGLQHVFPLGWNNIQFQRNLTSEATAINVPFNSKDLMHPYSIFYGQNLISRNPIFCDRKQLLNGNGVILATAGAGKSFSCKSNIEQIFMRYPNDHIIVIDPQNEYKPIIEKFHGQTINISASSGTRINPFDLSLNYGLTDEESNNPVKSKTEYIIAFIESIVGGNGLTGIQKTIIDRCCRIVYEKFELSGFTDLSLQPNFKDFYDVMNEQPEEEAKNLALVLERYVLGSMDIFSKDTNVDIHNRFVCFDISELQTSMQTTGYLVVLDHIMNRLAMNKKEGNYTWLFIDEFHILLQNEFSAQYIAKIYKVGRKLGAMNTVITQNITDVLNNEQGQKILSNSEFALLLKQKPLDLAQLSQIFDISKEEGDYITDSSVGKGLLVYGSESVLPFEFKVPKNTEIYRLNETSMISQSR